MIVIGGFLVPGFDGCNDIVDTHIQYVLYSKTLGDASPVMAYRLAEALHRRPLLGYDTGCGSTASCVGHISHSHHSSAGETPNTVPKSGQATFLTAHTTKFVLSCRRESAWNVFRPQQCANCNHGLTFPRKLPTLSRRIVGSLTTCRSKTFGGELLIRWSSRGRGHEVASPRKVNRTKLKTVYTPGYVKDNKTLGNRETEGSANTRK